MKKVLLSTSVVLFLCCSSGVFAQSIEKAEMLSQHGLDQEAKVELINVVFSKNAPSAKAKAYYLLGSIAFEKNNVSAALKSWEALVQKYPSSQEAALVKDRINELAEIVGETAEATISNAIALSYLRHGDFWSSGKGRTFGIDTSWIPSVETAVKWYDKVIEEFPKSSASRTAHKAKLRTILGWEELGRYGSKYGIKDSYTKYMPQLLKAFTQFEAEHPDAPELQAFRFQIAQTYWKNKDWVETRKWLALIIETSNGQDTFYKDLAVRRLAKVEY